MHPFGYVRASDVNSAITSANHHTNSAFIAGGTGLVDLMQDSTELPELLVDINPLPLATITADSQSVRIGAMTRISDVAEHLIVRDRYPVLLEALSYTAHRNFAIWQPLAVIFCNALAVLTFEMWHFLVIRGYQDRAVLPLTDSIALTPF